MDNKLILLGLIGAVLLTSGCMDSTQEAPVDNMDVPEETGEETQASVDRTITISGGPGVTYNTSEVDVEAGETVRFVYTHEGGRHDLVLEENGQRVAGTEVLTTEGATDSFTYTFEEGGSYQFYCSVGTHRAQGMEGDIVLG